MIERQAYACIAALSRVLKSMVNAETKRYAGACPYSYAAPRVAVVIEEEAGVASKYATNFFCSF